MSIKHKVEGPRPLPRLDCTKIELERAHREWANGPQRMTLGAYFWARYGVAHRGPFPQLIHCLSPAEALRIARKELEE